MTDEEKREELLKICPELSLGLNEGDVNKGMIELIHNKLVAERHINVLIEKVLLLSEENKKLKDQFLRIEPLLRSQEGG
jgi:uncharacterized protein YbbK (DUF523 family)